MPRVSIYGASDDLIELCVDGKSVDELSGYSSILTMTIRSARGSIMISTVHGNTYGWSTTVALPIGHKDGELALDVALRMSETGYSMEASVDVEFIDTTSLIIQQGDEIKYALWAGKLMSWEAIEEARSGDKCIHSLYKSGVGACPLCRENQGG